MPVNLRGRSLLSLDDLSASEFRYLLKLAEALKTAKLAGNEQRRLEGRNIALIFEKDSTRTRSGFEVAAYDQGAHVTYLGPSGSQIGHKESMKDTARVLGRMYDAIEFRGYSQASARELAAFSGVPVYNGLTDEAHPTQTLADVMTMREFSHKHLSSMKIAFVGDIANNVARSLASGALKLGMDMRLIGPKELRPDRAFLDRLGETAEQSNGKLFITTDLAAGLADVDFVYTDVWLSMGEPEEH
jgi:ornithine carbamoyltransferase